LVNSPYGSKNALIESSVVSKEMPCTKSSNLPACSPASAAGVASAAASTGASAFADASSSDAPLEDAAFFAFLGAAFFSDSLEDDRSDEPEDAAFLAAFLAGALAAGFEESDEPESESSEDEAAFLAAFFAGLATTFGASEESESDELSLTFCFFFASAALALAALLALTLEAALALLVMTGLADESEEESESLLSLSLLSTFLAFFLESFLAASACTTTFFLSASFLPLFFESSTLCFLDGGSDDELELATCFLD